MVRYELSDFEWAAIKPLARKIGSQPSLVRLGGVEISPLGESLMQTDEEMGEHAKRYAKSIYHPTTASSSEPMRQVPTARCATLTDEHESRFWGLLLLQLPKRSRPR
jgi:hypothetical protein